MTVSVEQTRPSSISHNNHGQSSKLGNALRSLVLGTAIGLGTLAPTAAAVAQEKPPENVPVQENKQEEQKAPQKDTLSPGAKWTARILGAGLGAASYYALRRRLGLGGDSESDKS